MTARLRRAIWITWRVVLAAVVTFSALLLLWATSRLPWPQRSFELKKIRATEGVGFTAKMPPPWPGFTYAPRSGILTEDGRVLTPVNENAIVREQGRGTFRVGRERVLFSTSDGSDALTNGRKYRLRLQAIVPPPPRPFIFCAGGLAALLLLKKRLFVFAVWLRRSAVEGADGAPPISASAWALVLFVIALAARLGFLWLNPEYTDGQMSIRGTPYSDAKDWLDMAKSTARGGGVDATFPGMRALYPMFLASFFTWFGDSVPLAKGLQAMIGAASAALIFLILRRAMPPWPALATALFFAVDPRQVTQAGKLMTEPFGLLLILLSAWCLIVGGERRRIGWLFVAGAFLACSNLARPLTLFAFPFFVAVIAVNAFLRDPRRWRAAALHSMAFALGTVICLAPWVIRERVVHGIWAISANSSSALFAASTPEFGVWKTGVEAIPAQAGIPRIVKARHDFFQKRFRENLEKHPGFYAENVKRSFSAAAKTCANFSPVFRFAALGACGWLFLAAAIRRGPRAGIFTALAATFILAFTDARWGVILTITGACFTLGWRLFPGAVVMVCHFGGLLGSALFGNPDLHRVRLLIDWVEASWMLAGAYAVGSAAFALLLRIPIRPIHDRGIGDERPAPWLRRLGWGFAIFLVASISRLVFLNGFTTPPPRPQLLFTDTERAAHLREFTTRFPEWRRIADPALMAPPRSWKRRAFVEFGAIDKEAYHFPPGSGVAHWSGFFEPRPYEHTSFVFRVSGASFAGNVWTDFPGGIPARDRGTICLLIGLARLRPAVTVYFENSVEAVAIIPAPDFKPDFTRAIVGPVFPETQTLIDEPASPQ